MDTVEEIIRARDGDRDACARLFAQAFPTVRAWMCGILGDPVEAEDLTQQTFLRAFERLGQLRDPERFWPWLRAVARSVARNRLRRRTPPPPRPERVVADPADDAARDEESRTVRRALRRLPRRDRVILSLVHVEDLPIAQAARFLDLPVTTLRRRLAAAVARLGRALAREGIHHAV